MRTTSIPPEFTALWDTSQCHVCTCAWTQVELSGGSGPALNASDRAARTVLPIPELLPVTLYELGVSPNASSSHAAAKTIWRCKTDMARPARSR